MTLSITKGLICFPLLVNHPDKIDLAFHLVVLSQIIAIIEKLTLAH